MRRAERLFEIIQVLRRARRPMTAQEIADALETGQRTIYRDIAALMSRHVPIRGEAGVGYVLERGFDMPPLMLTPDEVEAVVLGAQWVAANGDRKLADAAVDVLSKIAAVVPAALRGAIDDPVVGTPPPRVQHAESIDLARLREWCRKEQKLRVGYADESGRATVRTVWPILVGYVGAVRALIAWCELRKDFRVFRTERIAAIEFLSERSPERRATLRKRWLASRAAPKS